MKWRCRRDPPRFRHRLMPEHMGFQNWVLSTALVGVAKSSACLKNDQKSAQFVLDEGDNFCQLSSALFQSLLYQCSIDLNDIKL